MNSDSKLRRLVILASGGGSNAENIIHFFQGRLDIEVTAIITNNSKAGVIERAGRAGVPVRVITKETTQNAKALIHLLEQETPTLIILAGYLKQIPNEVVETYRNRIINIHPSLLPKYGGKGMYGNRVHEAVFQNKETESGITIHYVNEQYDTGQIIEQRTVLLDKNDQPGDIADKIHTLEMQWYPVVIESVLNNL